MKSMTHFSKSIALFLTLVVLSNGLFAAQMSVTMIDDATKIQSLQDEQSPCHGEQSTHADEANDCCQGDCSGCLLSTSVSALLSVDLPTLPPADKLSPISNYLLPAHTSNLYRPPIKS